MELKKKHEKSCEKIKDIENEIIEDYNNGLSLKKIKVKYHIQINKIKKLLNDKGVKIRSFSESIKLAHKLYSESFKHSDETKAKLSKIRLEWMKK